MTKSAAPLLSPEYQEVLRAMHEQQKWGTKGNRFAPEIVAWYKKLGCTSLLDYGSGRETLRQTLEKTEPSIQVRCYDPGIRGRDADPEPADFVACTDVLEHIEPDLIHTTLANLDALMLKGGFFNIALSKAKKTLPDGRNAHLIIAGKNGWPMWLDWLKMHSWTIAKYEGGAKRFEVWLKK